MDLSILIPARNEEFLRRTVEDLLAHIEGKTEIIVVLDGYTTDLPTDPRLRIIHNPESIGQRAATNQACRLSEARYVMKVDAHCAFDKGFDVKMVKEMHEDWTMVPVMRNLHVFNWVCEDGHSRYQSPSGPCKECGKPTKKDIVWIPKEKPQSTSYCFDSEPHFQYFNEFKKRPEGKGDITETMSLQGSCFMLSRQKYWELDICDESFGSWGSQGIEVACKTWLSGGRVVVNHKTWYAHMFRTQGGDFGFPYPLTNEQTNKAKSMSRQIWFDNLWPKQIYPLSWLLEKFWPVPGWTEEQFAKIKAWPLPKDNPYMKQSAGIVYLVDPTLPHNVLEKSRKQVNDSKLPVTDVFFSKDPLTLFKQILIGLEQLETDVAFICFQDVLYHPSHFDFRPIKKDVYYYNLNSWQVRGDGFGVSYDAKKLNQLCANREFLIRHFKRRIELVEKNGYTQRMGYVPGSHSRPERVDDYASDVWRSREPNVEIPHEGSLVRARWSMSDFRDQKNCKNWKEADMIPGWGMGKLILNS
jgi:glycosyltransferase involved in cell wall biosynthesis